jgi:hypothetical protein
MKKILLILLLLPLLSISQDRKEKMKSIRIAYITSELNLTTDEISKFIPIFSEFDKKQHELKRKMRLILEKSKSIDDITENEAAEMLISSEKIEEEIFNNRKNLTSSLKNVLNSKKLLKFKKLELDFNKKLIEKIKERN